MTVFGSSVHIVSGMGPALDLEKAVELRTVPHMALARRTHWHAIIRRVLDELGHLVDRRRVIHRCNLIARRKSGSVECVVWVRACSGSNDGGEQREEGEEAGHGW